MGYVVVVVLVLVILYLLYQNDAIQQLNEDGQPVSKDVQGYVNWLMAGVPGLGDVLRSYGKQPWLWVIVALIATYIFKKK
jgi:Na+-driven multidrug efflux pump